MAEREELIVVKVKDTDIICGVRGVLANTHAGNVYCRVVTQALQPEYRKLEKREKKEFIINIVRPKLNEGLDEPVRFVVITQETRKLERSQRRARLVDEDTIYGGTIYEKLSHQMRTTYQNLSPEMWVPWFVKLEPWSTLRLQPENMQALQEASSCLFPHLVANAEVDLPVVPPAHRRVASDESEQSVEAKAHAAVQEVIASLKALDDASPLGDMDIELGVDDSSVGSWSLDSMDSDWSLDIMDSDWSLDSMDSDWSLDSMDSDWSLDSMDWDEDLVPADELVFGLRFL